MILVTGSSGHIGNVLVRELCNRGEQVLLMTKTGEIPLWLEDQNVKVCKGELTNKDEVDRAIASVEYVFHLAGIISISSFDSQELFDVNVTGTQHVLDACIKHGVKRLVYTSSVHALPEGENNEAITESKNVDPKKLFGAYARTKAEATRRVFEANDNGLDLVVCYPSGVMGPYDFRGSEAGRLVRDYATNKLPIYINGAYNFVDVRDVVQGLLLALDNGKNGEDYILAGEKMTLNQFFDILSSAEPQMKKPRIKFPVSLAIGSAWILEIASKLFRFNPLFTVYAIKVLQSNSNISSDKAKNELGYSPRAMKVCIPDTLVWLKENDKI